VAALLVHGQASLKDASEASTASRSRRHLESHIAPSVWTASITRKALFSPPRGSSYPLLGNLENQTALASGISARAGGAVQRAIQQEHTGRSRSIG
jgi:hypothetical protein